MPPRRSMRATRGRGGDEDDDPTDELSNSRTFEPEIDFEAEYIEKEEEHDDAHQEEPFAPPPPRSSSSTLRAPSQSAFPSSSPAVARDAASSSSSSQILDGSMRAPPRAPLRSKPKPKIIRRTAEQREKSEREELERAQARAKTDGDKGAQGGNQRGGGIVSGSRGGRGGLQHQTGGRSGSGHAVNPDRTSHTIPEGPFGMGSTIVPKKKARGGSSQSTSRPPPTAAEDYAPPHPRLVKDVKATKSSKAAPKKPSVKKEASTGLPSLPTHEHDSFTEIPRVSVQHISLLSSPSVSPTSSHSHSSASDSQDDPNDSDSDPRSGRRRRSLKHRTTTSPPTWSLRPVCVERREHIERSIAVDGTSTSLRRSSTSHQGHSASGEVEITGSTTRQPQQPRRGSDTIKPDPPSTAPKRKSKSRTRGSARASPQLSPFATEEERVEHAYRSEARGLLEEVMKRAPGGTVSEDVDMEDGFRVPSLSRRNSASALPTSFLFQFPPLMPDLYDPKAKRPRKEAEATATADKSGEEGNAMVIDDGDSTAQAPPPTGNAPPKDSKPNPNTQDEISTSAPSPPTPPLFPPKNPPGLAGTLTLHASGRLRLSWGEDLVCDVARGVETNFLQDVVLAVPDRESDDDDGEEMDEGEDGERARKRGRKTGVAVNLGTVTECLVVTPDLEALFAVGEGGKGKERE